MLIRSQLIAKNSKSGQADPAIIGRSPLGHVVLIKNRFAMTAWRTGEQRARE
jgi:hypothetical protein